VRTMGHTFESCIVQLNKYIYLNKISCRISPSLGVSVHSVAIHVEKGPTSPVKTLKYIQT
jgi:hypothetical protein